MTARSDVPVSDTGPASRDTVAREAQNSGTTTLTGVPITLGGNERARTFYGRLAPFVRACVMLVTDAYTHPPVTEYGIALSGPVPTKATVESKRARLAYIDASRELDLALAQLCDEAAMVSELRTHTPGTTGDALFALHVAAEDYHVALHTWAAACADHRALDDMLGRKRRECMKLVAAAHAEAHNIEQPDKPSAYKPLSDTALEKQAGDHPDYIAHRAMLVDAANVMDDALVDVRVAEQRMLTLRIIADSYLNGALAAMGGRLTRS